MAVRRFKLGTKVYSMTSIEQITLRDLMLFNTQAAAMGLGKTWADVERVSAEMNALGKDEAEAHPDKMLLVGVTVWASRRAAGDTVTFEEAVDVPFADIEFLRETADHAGPTKARKGQGKKAPKVSAAAAVLEADEESTTPPTSNEPSTSASSS